MFEENWDDPDPTSQIHTQQWTQTNYKEKSDGIPNETTLNSREEFLRSQKNSNFKSSSCWKFPSKPDNTGSNTNNWRSRDTNNLSKASAKNKDSKSDFLRNNNEKNRRNTDSRRNFQEPQQIRNQSTVFSMRVKATKIGLLIGKQGSKIKELERITQTRIKIEKSCEDDPVFTEVLIFGKKEDQTACKDLIEELVYEQPKIYATIREKEEVPVIDWDTINELADQAEKEKWANLPPIKKNFYIEDPEVTNMSEEEVEEFRKNNNNIMVGNVFGESEPVMKPVKTFSQAFRHYPDILREIENQGFKTPSPIQCQAWPILMSGKDLIGIAQTGTGKTLAFILPALIHIKGQEVPMSKKKFGPDVLVLAPTRELALQIEKEVQKYSYKGITSMCVYGGTNVREQIKQISKRFEIIIATPGRLIDMVERKVINLSSVTYVVLDEADRMLDMGFEPQIRKILLQIRPDRQSVMTSATWPSRVQSLAKNYMSNPVHVCIGSLDLTTTHSVTQTVLVVRENEKKDYLVDFINNLEEDDKVIVFVTRKKDADRLSCDLTLDQILCQCIHGDREQSDREQALDDLKTGLVKILIATDVASRGIDIPDITKVLNFDFPKNIEDYVHRVGRCGRAGKKGETFTLFTYHDRAHAAELITILEEAEQAVPLELYSLRDKPVSSREKNSHRGRGRRD